MFKKINKGSTIGVLSPAWIPLKERLANGIKYLEEQGYKVKLSKNINEKHGYFAGSDEQRINDIHDFFKDEEISAILATRGGWGTLKLLDKIDYELIKNNPKPFIGYSDITTLQLAIWKKTGIGSISGPMCAVEMGKGMHEFTEKHFWNYLNNIDSRYNVNINETPAKELVSGTAKGTLLGGCLSLVSSILGTPYCPDFSGSILFLEDVGEKPYKIDRYFAHLRQAGIFNKISGLILGEFLDCESEDDSDSFSIQYLIEEYFGNAQYPVIYNFPYGHGDVKVSMPIGSQTILNTKKNLLQFENLFKN